MKMKTEQAAKGMDLAVSETNKNVLRMIEENIITWADMPTVQAIWIKARAKLLATEAA